MVYLMYLTVQYIPCTLMYMLVQKLVPIRGGHMAQPTQDWTSQQRAASVCSAPCRSNGRPR